MATCHAKQFLVVVGSVTAILSRKRSEPTDQPGGTALWMQSSGIALLLITCISSKSKLLLHCIKTPVLASSSNFCGPSSRHLQLNATDQLTEAQLQLPLQQRPDFPSRFRLRDA